MLNLVTSLETEKLHQITNSVTKIRIALLTCLYTFPVFHFRCDHKDIVYFLVDKIDLLKCAASHTFQGRCPHFVPVLFQEIKFYR